MLGRGRECSRRLIASNLQSTIRDLQRRKARGRRGLALIEGVRLVEEALAARVAFKGALVAPDLARTARGTALGAAGTVVLRGTADPTSPKALRAAMGATFRHPIVSLDDSGFIVWAREHDLTLWASAADGVPLHRALDRVRGKPGAGRVDGPIAVIVGNEGAGIRPQLNAVAAQRVAIPLAQGAESLNVAVAAGILLYEVTRGR